MNPANASAAALLTELVRRGIELQAHGDRLRYRPRSALTPELVEHVKARKTELLALLRCNRAQEPQQSGEDRPTASLTPRADGIGRPDAPEHQDSPSVPHEL